MNDYLDYLYCKDDSLSHHGILSQKHGVRNGPPYPLSRSRMSSAEKKNNPGLVKEKAKEAKEKISSAVSTAKNKMESSKKTEEKSVEPIKQEVKVLAKAQDVYNARNSLSDKEIQNYLSRVQLEAKLKDLSDKEYAKEHPVKTFLNDQKDKLAKDLANDAANAGRKYLKNTIEGFVKEASKELGVNLNGKKEDKEQKEEK